MGPLVRNAVLGIICVVAAATPLSAQATAGLLPQRAKIPLSKIPRVHRALQLEDFLENHPREAELTVTDFRQNTPGAGGADRCDLHRGAGIRFRLRNPVGYAGTHN